MSRAFPWHQVPSLTHAELSAQRALLDLLGAMDTSGWATTSTSVLRDDVRVQTRGLVGARSATSVESTSVAVMLTLRDDAATLDAATAVVVELDVALAAVLVAAALDQRRPRVTVHEDAGSASLWGATAAVLVALGRRMALPLRVLAVGPGPRLLADLERAAGSLARQAVDVTVGGEVFGAGLWCGSARGRSKMQRRAQAAESAAPIGFTVVLSRTVLAVHEARSLGVGDVFVPLPQAHALTPEGLQGPVWLVPSGGDKGFAAECTPPGLRFSRKVVALGFDPGNHEMTMTEPTSSEGAPSAPATMPDLLNDAPVVLRVELSQVELPARAWAGLREGDVIPLGVSPSTPVVLRVSGVELARGSLVLVDGEVGVRITQKVSP